MADLKLITVEPYHTSEINEQEFKHHYDLNGTLFKAGEEFDWRKYVTRQDDVAYMETLLEKMSTFYGGVPGSDDKAEHDLLVEQLEEIEAEIGLVEKENQRNRAEFTAKLKDDPQDRRVYFKFCHMEATMLELDGRRKMILANLSKPSVWTAAATKLIQGSMRALLPLVATKDGKFFVWHAPDEAAKLKPDMLRDYPMILEQLLGKEELLRLIQMRRSLMQGGKQLGDHVPGMIRG